MSKRKFEEAKDLPGLSAFAARRKLQDVNAVSEQLDRSKETVTGVQYGQQQNMIQKSSNIEDLDEPQSNVILVDQDAVGRRGASHSPCSSEDSRSFHAYVPASLQGRSPPCGLRENSSDSERRSSPETSAVQLSTFRPNAENVIENTRTRLRVKLKPEESLAILGQYDLHVKSGVVRLLGATLRASETLHRVYAPSTHALPTITAALGEEDSSPTAEIELVACKSGIRRLKSISPYFARIWNAKSDEPGWPFGSLDAGKRSFTPICVSTDDKLKRQLQPLKINESWASASSLITRRSLVGQLSALICGAKSLGKSTFMRHLINNILTTPRETQPDFAYRGSDGCVLLDFDLGQPEFAPPGSISLVDVKEPIFGPPFTHPSTNPSDKNKVVRAHFVAGVSSNADPFHFRAAAADLLRTYREHMFPAPLIINCPGWIEGTQLEILTQFIKDISPTDVVLLDSNTPAHIVQPLEDAKGAASWHILSAENPRYPSRTSSQLKLMHTVSYFHLANPENGRLQWDATSVTAQYPWLVRYHGAHAGIFGIMVLGDPVPLEHLVTILDGSLVAVVVLEDDDNVTRSPGTGSPECVPTTIANEDGSDILDINAATTSPLDRSGRWTDAAYSFTRSITPENLPYLHEPHTNALDPSKSHCIGLGLVRGIDTTRHHLQLLTPIPKATIKDLLKRRAKIVLVCGKLDSPSWAYTEDMAQEGYRARRQKKEDSVEYEERAELLAEQLRKGRRGRVPWITRLGTQRQGTDAAVGEL